MYLPELKIIYIHIPKTGGNYIQNQLKAYTNDDFVLSGNQDGVQRFEVKGDFTRTKHATLGDYLKAMPQETFNCTKLITSIRHPFERMLSLYYSPHNFLTKDDKSSYDLRTFIRGSFVNHNRKNIEEPIDRRRFEKMVKNSPNMISYIDSCGTHKSLDWIVRYETFMDDIQRIFREIGITVPRNTEKVNKSANDTAKTMNSKDPVLEDIVLKYHGADYDFFGYSRRT